MISLFIMDNPCVVSYDLIPSSEYFGIGKKLPALLPSKFTAKVGGDQWIRNRSGPHVLTLKSATIEGTHEGRTSRQY